MERSTRELGLIIEVLVLGFGYFRKQLMMFHSKDVYDWCHSLVTVKGYRVLWTGMGAQLARDVPFSAICWSTLEPVSLFFNCCLSLGLLWIATCFSTKPFYYSSPQLRRKLLGLVGDNTNAASVLGANFSAGFVAGSLAAAATCPLDVAKTRRQIEVYYLNHSVRICWLNNWVLPLINMV